MKIVVHIPLTLTFDRTDEEVKEWLGLDEDDPAPSDAEILQHILDEVEPELAVYLDEASEYSCADPKIEVTRT